MPAAFEADPRAHAVAGVIARVLRDELSADVSAPEVALSGGAVLVARFYDGYRMTVSISPGYTIITSPGVRPREEGE